MNAMKHGTLLAAALSSAVAMGGETARDVAAAESAALPISKNVRGHENVEWSIAYAFGLTDANRDLPRVLLVGDSICHQYADGVRSLLKGKVNVSYWVSSYCATSPNYLTFLGIYLEEAKYDVVHFNQGLHSLGTDLGAWKAGLEAALRLIREKQPAARIFWTTMTPYKDAAKTAKVKERNAAAAEVVARLGGIETDDLFALLDPLDREEFWADSVHHKAPAREKESAQVAASVLSALSAQDAAAKEEE